MSIAKPAIVKIVKKATAKSARSLQKICNTLSEQLSITITHHTLRRFLKKLGYRWKRFRKSLKDKQDEAVYNEKLKLLKQLIGLHKIKFIDLFFVDESIPIAIGINLEGYIPYGWQPAGQYITITPAKTKAKNIFGIMSLDNHLEAYESKGSMNSAMVIAFIDDFIKKIKQPTVLVIDNAPIHHSNAFKLKIEEWKKDDLYIFYLPKYAPLPIAIGINPIEILWRKIKYEWLEYENIDTMEQLENQLFYILNNFGQEYHIKFKELDDKKVSNIFA